MNTPVVDMHSHVGRQTQYWMHDAPDPYVRIMDAAGVNVAPVSCIFFDTARHCNEAVANFVALNPDRFFGVAHVTPRYLDEAMEELERVFKLPEFKMLKLYPDYLGKPIDDPSYFPIFKWCDDHRIVVKSHSSYTSESDNLTSPLRFIGLAEKYPNIRWVLGHSGNAMAGQIQAVEAAQSSRNIWLETCTSIGEAGTIEFLVDGAGADRVLYGSDMPLMDARPQIARIATANLDDDSKRQVLGLNAIELLDIKV
jgi:predicted TIM-barrel fold metal-dependent hydrolase